MGLDYEKGKFKYGRDEQLVVYDTYKNMLYSGTANQWGTLYDVWSCVDTMIFFTKEEFLEKMRSENMPEDELEELEMKISRQGSIQL